MPNTLVHSKWSSGALVFHDADDYGVGAEILRIAQDDIAIGTSTNDVTLTIYGDITLSGDIALATEDISVAQGKYIYLEGQDSTTYLRADAVGYLMANAATGVNLAIGGTDEVTLTATALTVGTTTSDIDVKIFMGGAAYYALFDVGNTQIRLNNVDIIYYGADPAITLDQAAGINFRSSGSRIYSNDTGRLIISCTSISVAALQLNVGTGGGIWLNSYLILCGTDTDDADARSFWFDASEKGLKFHDGVGVCRPWFTNSTAVCYPQGNLTMQTTQQINFRDTTQYIVSGSSTRLDMVAGTIYLNATAEIQLTNYLRIASCSAGSVIGQLWYNTTTHKLQYFEGGGGGVKTITAS